MSRLRHPTIVDIFDFGTTSEGITFLVMELLDGPSLLGIIASNARERSVRATRQHGRRSARVDDTIAKRDEPTFYDP